MAHENRFTSSVVATLAKRAANQCSNPACGALTSGPTQDPNDSINVGEAAHIYGANEGSARFDPNMTPVERASISNAIWLCATCHKLVDDDENKHPAGLLYEWQRSHEERIAQQVGKTAATTRQQYERRHLEEFGRLSYLAERLILEKGDFWEYLLTAEVLRYEMGPTLQRWGALERGLYVKQTVKIEETAFASWLSGKMTEAEQLATAFSALMNREFARSWGEPGVAGSDVEIVVTCRLVSEMCAASLAWEEDVRFSRVDGPFEAVHSLLRGVAGDFINQARKLPVFLSNVIDQKPSAGGNHELKLVLTLPEGFAAKMRDATQRAIAQIRRRG